MLEEGVQQRRAGAHTLLWVATASLLACSPHGSTAADQANRPILSYCQRLQPRLDEASQRASIGSQLTCLDLPGITEIGRFGPEDVPEEGELSACFDSPEAYASVVERRSEPFELALEQDFTFVQEGEVGVQLSRLIPWVPNLSAQLAESAHLRVHVSIEQAHFVTLVEVASSLQSQRRAADCLRALCAGDYRFVHKALVGVPTARVSAVTSAGEGIDLELPAAQAGWQTRRADGRAVEVSSTKPVTIAVARSAFRTPYTEPLCAPCGNHEQRCCLVDAPCGAGLACDGGRCEPAGEVGQLCDGGQCQPGSRCIDQRCLSVGQPGQQCDAGQCTAGAACVRDVCVAAGKVGQPCDHGHCAGGALCVEGACRSDCGGSGAVCCPGDTCGAGLSCGWTQPEEVRVSSERIDLDGGWFGTSQDRLFGAASCGTNHLRTRHFVRKVAGDGECDRAWWFVPARQQDCRVGAHVAVPSFGDLECLVEVYARAEPQRRCLPR